MDLETTGGNFLVDRIIEVGIIRVEDGEVVKTYQSLVNPLCTVPPEIASFTGINPDELETAPTFAQLKSDVWDLLSGSVFVAHNARFDYSFLRSEFLRLDHNFKARNLCTVKLSRHLFPSERHHNLTSIIQRCGLSCLNRHRALGDAQAVWDFLQYLLKTVDSAQIQQAIKTVFRRPAKPVQISEKVIDSLPDGPGVYIFYGDNKLPLYIGKSRDIRSRVLDHFSDSISSPKKLLIYQQVKDIDFVETAGDLGAQLLESRLIKTLKPTYNRQLRNSTQSTIVTADFKLKTVSHLDYDTAINSWGVFRRKSQAKKILDSVVIDSWLKGRSEKMHNLHLQMAFAPLKIKLWPFPGPIAIPEENLFTKKSAVHIFHLWSHLGTYESLDDWQKGEVVNNSPELAEGFDLDTYHILRRYLRQSNPRLKVL